MQILPKKNISKNFYKYFLCGPTFFVPSKMAKMAAEIKMAQSKKMEQSKDFQQQSPKSSKVRKMKIENLNVRLEKYQKSKTACVKITSCSYKAVVLQNIPKVSSPIYTVQYLKAPKPCRSGLAKILSRVQIQTLQLIQCETLFPNPLPPTNSLISVELPSDDEIACVEFDIPVIKR